METAAVSGSAFVDPEASELVVDARARERRRAEGRDLWSGLLLGAGFLAVAVPLALFLDSTREPALGAIASLTIAYGLACTVRFEVGASVVVPSQLVLVPMLFVIPVGLVPLCVAAGILLSLLLSWRPGQRHLSRAPYIAAANSWFALGPALVLGLGLEAPRLPDFGHWPYYVGALAAQFALEAAISVLRPWFVAGVSPRRQLPTLLHGFLVDTALAPVALAVAFVSYWDPAGVALVVPLVGLLAYFSRERKARIDHALALGHAYRGTAMLLGDVVEADDAYTGTHSKEVVTLVLAVCDRLGITGRERQQAEFVALLHDVGKIRVPNQIINKAGPLTPDERAVIEQHTVEGQRMLDTVGGMLGEVGRLVRSCHERWDGGGYPDGLAGEEIPLVSRIVCACDAYDAMTTDRPYRRALAPEAALAELVRCAGAQFDPAVVEAVVAVVGVDPAAERSAA